MKLSEIKRPDSKEARKYLEKNGWTELGKGMQATVYKHPKFDYVVKIFQATDKGYLAFLDLIKKHPSNPHLPKILSTKPYKLEDCYAIRMEKLQNFSSFSKIGDKLASVQWYVTHLIDKDHKPNLEMHPLVRKFVEDPDNKELVETCDLLFPLVKKYGYDMAQGNVLARDNTLVFIDPVGSESTQ